MNKQRKIEIWNVDGCWRWHILEWHPGEDSWHAETPNPGWYVIRIGKSSTLEESSNQSVSNYKDLEIWSKLFL